MLSSPQLQIYGRNKMNYQRKAFRKIFGALQVAAACAIASAQTCPPLPAGAIYPPSGTMAAWYPFDGLTGPSTNLATGNAAVWDSPTLPVYNPTGKVAGALNFNGNSYIDAPDSIATNFGPAGGATCSGGDYSTCQGDFSIDVWINLNPGALPLNGYYAIVDKGGTYGSVTTGYIFYLYGYPPDDNGNPWMGLTLGDKKHGISDYGSTGLASPSGVGITTGVWHHLAVTVSRKSPGILWYLDGNLLGPSTGPIPTQTGSLLNSEAMRIGGFNPSSFDGASNFDGSLDELQIFNRALTAREVANIFNAGAAGQCKP
jgi:hypothetical protein